MDTLKTPLLDGRSVDEKRAEIKSYFKKTTALYQQLFDCISNEKAYFLRAEPLRHPLIFYYGHTAVFFVNKLVLGQFITKRINGTFESMFSVGVDEMSWDDLNMAHYDWPSIEEVAAYRRQVNQLVLQCIDTMPIELPIQEDSMAWVILMGIEHEHIHLETSSVIMRMLPLHYLKPSSEWKACSEKGEAPDNQLIAVPGRKLLMGRAKENRVYGWDNEYGSREVEVGDFYASKFLVSNQEFLAFVRDGGYQDKRWWSPEGYAWLNYSKAQMPHFWSYKKGQFYQRNIFEEIPLPLNWPVEVNYLEAKAFCNWKSSKDSAKIRLPTEEEWTILRSAIAEDMVDWKKAPGNINLEYYASSCPVDTYKQGDFYDVLGNVWQWTESFFDALPGFKVHKLYDDFSTPTFDGRHNVIKGGSWISTGNLATKHARYAFRRHFFQHAGFRYVQSETEATALDVLNPYETDTLVSQYMEFHYGEPYFDVPNYPLACIDACKHLFMQQPRLLALDLGCSVGRASFELAKYFSHVDAIDLSARFIQEGVLLKQRGLVRYVVTTEGDLVDYKEVQLAPLGYADLTDKVDFIQGDACNLKPIFKDYNLIFCGNLIDRLYDPALFLKSISTRLAPGGLLVIASPYTWLPEFTAKDKWIGGIKVNGESQTTLEGLKALLPQFNLLMTKDIPLVLRETQRKFQHSVAELTVWQLK